MGDFNVTMQRNLQNIHIETRLGSQIKLWVCELSFCFKIAVQLLE